MTFLEPGMFLPRPKICKLPKESIAFQGKIGYNGSSLCKG